MKKWAICAATMAAIGMGITSCHQKLPEPDTDYNSEVGVSGIKFYNLPFADSIIGYIDLSASVPNDTIPNQIDTISQSERFYPMQVLNTTQKYYFNTPDNTKSIQFRVRFLIYNGWTADSMSVDEFYYKRNGTTLISAPIHYNYAEATYVSSPFNYTF